MPPRSDTKRSRLERWMADHSPARVDMHLFREIRESAGPMSESYLRQLLRETGVPLSPDVEGVVASSLPELKRTLLALSEIYAGGGRHVRAQVIEAKTRLRFAASRATDESKKQLREEMLLWTLTWLENPSAFEFWVEIRERIRGQALS